MEGDSEKLASLQATGKDKHAHGEFLRAKIEDCKRAKHLCSLLKLDVPTPKPAEDPVKREAEYLQIRSEIFSSQKRQLQKVLEELDLSSEEEAIKELDDATQHLSDLKAEGKGDSFKAKKNVQILKNWLK